MNAANRQKKKPQQKSEIARVACTGAKSLKKTGEVGAVVKKRTGCTVRLPPTARLSPTFCCYYFSVCFSAFPPRRHTLMLVTLLLLLFACQRLSQIRKQTHKHSHTHTRSNCCRCKINNGSCAFY